ncbi:hypothetical protein P261_02784 [Lachnospiraceae bacterium TWA4]|nr:hypothetical protein P261_02784 [Lachnospiraceae bacterium TWA4]
MSFEAKDYSISDVLNKAVFDIPRNQRRYVWKKEHWEDLFEDLIFSIDQKKPHFLGSVVLKENGKKDSLSYYTIIDGQQRLTTIILLLIALMKHFNERSLDNDFMGTISYIRSKNTRNQDIEILNSDFHLSLKSLIEGIINIQDRKCTISAFVDSHLLSKSRDKEIGDAIKKFYFLIRDDLEKYENADDRLRDIRAALLDMTVVKIVSSTDEDSYTIFEILNARGQELESYELLKNYIMRYIQPIERRDDAKSQWEDMEKSISTAMNKFIKHYATHRFGDTKDKYNSPYEAIQKKTRGQNISALFDDIKLKSEYYLKIIKPSKGPGGNCTDIEYLVFNFFRVKRFEQFRPILLSLIHQYELQKISRENYEKILTYIYNFFVCYTIIGEEKSNKLEDVVFKYARLLEESYTDKLLFEFAKSIKDKMPGYDWFLNSFKNVGWSNHFDLYKGEKTRSEYKLF